MNRGASNVAAAILFKKFFSWPTRKEVEKERDKTADQFCALNSTVKRMLMTSEYLMRICMADEELEC